MQMYTMGGQTPPPRWFFGQIVALLLAIALAFGVALAFLVGGTQSSQASVGRLFGYTEKRSANIKPFIKWTGTLDRYFKERTLEDKPCSSGLFNKCHLKDWKRFLNEVKGADKMTQLERVNDYMNRAPYIVDPVNYGVPDYWATPQQFFVKDGDCEDYAIAKYLSLRALGWPTDKMRIVVLMDNNLRIPHAVLVVYHEGKTLVLDNQIRQVVTDNRIRHYRPIYSINEHAWWLHRSRG